MWWMREQLGKDVCVVREGVKENRRFPLNRLWVYVGKNIDNLLESWADQDEDNDYGLWSEGTRGTMSPVNPPNK